MFLDPPSLTDGGAASSVDSVDKVLPGMRKQAPQRLRHCFASVYLAAMAARTDDGRPAGGRLTDEDVGGRGKRSPAHLLAVHLLATLRRLTTSEDMLTCSHLIKPELITQMLASYL